MTSSKCTRSYQHSGLKQSGMALIFCLLISMLLGTFAAYFTYKARQHITLAERISTQIELRTEAESQMNKAIYAVSSLNLNSIQWPGKSDTQWKPAFWGKALEVDANTQVSYQDLSSKLNIIPFSANEWLGVLQFHGVDPVTARGIVDKIEDWMDKDSFKRIQGLEKRDYVASGLPYPRDGLMQSVDELSKIPGLDKVILSKLKGQVSYWGSSDRSPLMGTKAMILAYGNEQLYNRVLELRNNAQTTQHLYNEISNIDTSLINGIVSGQFEISIKVTKRDATFIRSAEVNMRGTEFMPFYMIGWK